MSSRSTDQYSSAVSVVIPVYKAGKYLSQAVRSALNQDKVGEVILIEDGSPDDSLERCQELASVDQRIKVLRHPGGENLGAGPSRNLGLTNCTMPYVAFLDADDYYCENRFKASIPLMEGNKDIDGVYDAVGYYLQEFETIGPGLTTVPERTLGRELFKSLIAPKKGHFHTNGITLRRSSINNMQWFRNDLRLHQDTEFWVRLAYHLNLVPGNTSEPVAMRRVHPENRISSANFSTRADLYGHLVKHFRNEKLSFKEKRLLAGKYALLSTPRSEYNSAIQYYYSRALLYLNTLLSL